MDPFVAITLGGTGGLVIALGLLGRVRAGSGTERQVDRTPTRAAELDVRSESDDLDQMLAAVNARRRARGRPELSEAALAAEIAQETARARRRRCDDAGAEELAQLLDAKNARRLRKGLSPLRLEDYERQVRGPL